MSKPKSHEYKGVEYREDDGMFYVEIDGNVRDFDSEASVKRAITRYLKALKDAPATKEPDPEEPEETEEEEVEETAPKKKGKAESGKMVTVISLPMKASGRKEGRSNGILFVDGEAKIPRKQALAMCKSFPNSYALKGKK